MIPPTIGASAGIQPAEVSAEALAAKIAALKPGQGLIAAVTSPLSGGDGLVFTVTIRMIGVRRTSGARCGAGSARM